MSDCHVTNRAIRRIVATREQVDPQNASYREGKMANEAARFQEAHDLPTAHNPPSPTRGGSPRPKRRVARKASS